MRNNEKIMHYLNTKMFDLVNSKGVRSIWKDIFTLENNCLIVKNGDDEYPTNLNNLIRYISNKTEKRLALGSRKYLKEVPITKSECKKHSRDNLEEAIEELLDLLVYLSAVILTDEDLPTRELLERELNSLLFSAFTLVVCYKSTQQRLTIKGDTTHE